MAKISINSKPIKDVNNATIQQVLASLMQKNKVLNVIDVSSLAPCGLFVSMYDGDSSKVRYFFIPLDYLKQQINKKEKEYDEQGNLIKPEKAEDTPRGRMHYFYVGNNGGVRDKLQKCYGRQERNGNYSIFLDGSQQTILPELVKSDKDALTILDPFIRMGYMSPNATKVKRTRSK